MKIVAAARELFVERGYRGTTLSDVASAAGIADRTIYLRFATKGDLLKRVVDVAVVGDTAAVALADRDWVSAVMTASTLDDRLRADAAGSAELMERIAPVLAIAVQAEGEEPLIARAAQAAREDTLAQTRLFWERAGADGLLGVDVDLEWVIATAALLGNAEAYLHMTRTLRWTADEYRDWRYRTWSHLATTPSPKLDVPAW